MPLRYTVEPPLREELRQSGEMRVAGAWLLAAAALLFLTNGIERTTPDEVGARSLVDVAAFPSEYRARIRATSVALAEQGLEPSEFYGKFVQQRGDTILCLLHVDSFRWRLVDDYTLRMGNRTGKSRYAYFDEDGRVTKVLLQR